MIDIVAALAHSPFIIFLVILTAITLAVTAYIERNSQR